MWADSHRQIGDKLLEMLINTEIVIAHKTSQRKKVLQDIIHLEYHTNLNRQ